MLTKDGIIIYEGPEIFRKLSNEYLRSFQAKMYIFKDPWRKSEKTLWCDVKLGIDESGKESIHYHSPIDRVLRLPESMKLNEWYIVTIFGMHHQQLINSVVLDVNFLISEKKTIFTMAHRSMLSWVS